MFCYIHPLFQFNWSLRGFNSSKRAFGQRDCQTLQKKRERKTYVGETSPRQVLSKWNPTYASRRVSPVWIPKAYPVCLDRTTFSCLRSRQKFDVFLFLKVLTKRKCFSTHVPSFSQVSGGFWCVPPHLFHFQPDQGRFLGYGPWFSTKNRKPLTSNHRTQEHSHHKHLEANLPILNGHGQFNRERKGYLKAVINHGQVRCQTCKPVNEKLASCKWRGVLNSQPPSCSCPQPRPRAR